MIIIWGSRLYGKVDEVPGLFHVATKFAHLWYIPLFPIGQSHAVLDQNKEGFRGVPVGMSGRSVFAAYLRGWGVVAVLVLGIITIGGFSSGPPGAPALWVPVAATAAALGLTIWAFVARTFRKASYERAVELGEQIGLSDEAKIFLEFAFEHISKEDFEKAMEEAQRDRAELERLMEERRESRAVPATPPPLPKTRSGAAPR